MTGHSLILGGARSGKSRYAEDAALGLQLRPIYVATGAADDGEMAARVAAHQARRDRRWQTIEEPLDLAQVLARESTAGSVILIDCLTLWLSNLMAAGRDIASARDGLLAALAAAAGPVIMVSNEVGLGIVPMNPLARQFRDEAGYLHQAVATLATQVVFMAAGLPLVMKGAAQSVPSPQMPQP
ncbi:MAG: bifunctional adenosylcobinamide kinase/adenosylcobinamide-phosphate guanylyltransferase [Rhodospirillaceae bacterium]